VSVLLSGDLTDAREPPAGSPKPGHSLSESLALAAPVIGRVLDGASLNQALRLVKARSPSLRAAAQDLSYNALRGWGRIDVIAARLLDKPLADTALRGLLLASLAELFARPATAHTVVHQAVEAATLLGQPRARGLVNAVLRSYQRQAGALHAQIDATETGRYAHPQWWIDALKSAYPGQWQQILEAANVHPPMTLRVNSRRTTVADYLSRLGEAGIAARPLGGGAVTLEQPRPVDSIPGFAAGEVSVQDAGAQHAAVLLDVQAGMAVLDACAAPGGKTGHILELADCSLTAVDASTERARRIKENLSRLELLAEVRVGDSLHPESFVSAGAKFDRILLDAPCTASGVVRRHPDIRWLRREADLTSFARTQARMLDALWPLLRRDGKLLYTSCSVFPVENAMQIKEFLSRHAEARLLPLAGLADGQILPGADSDGFYYALLHKIE
jgi:16S rRNA (cytosine967-C5)-methyltransferase